jgi:hypothetical protein
MCGAMPPILYAFMSCTETALIATITCSCVSCSNRQEPISNVCCTCNRTYPHLRCNAVYSGKILTFRRNILPQSSGCSGDEDHRCLCNVCEPLASLVLRLQYQVVLKPNYYPWDSPYHIGHVHLLQI